MLALSRCGVTSVIRPGPVAYMPGLGFCGSCSCLQLQFKICKAFVYSKHALTQQACQHAMKEG